MALRNQVFINDGVSDYILNQESRFPQSIIMNFPFITNLLSKVHIPIMEKEDACIWSPVEDGILTKKVVYMYKQVAAPILIWGNFIWNIHVPTSKSLLF